MNTPEVLELCTSEIYERCIEVFKKRGIEPQLTLFILDSVYKKFQNMAMEETIKHLAKLTLECEVLKGTLATDKGEDKDGDTA